jgi:hypothetical protein
VLAVVKAPWITGNRVVWSECRPETLELMYKALREYEIRHMSELSQEAVKDLCRLMWDIEDYLKS